MPHNEEFSMSRKPKRDHFDNDYRKGEHADDVRADATICINLFLKDKNYFCGGKIPERELNSDVAQQTVLYTEFDDRCFEFIHDHCLTLFPKHPKYRDNTVPWTVHCLLGMLRELKSLGIPKQNQPGLILLYFKYCFDVKIPEPLML